MSGSIYKRCTCTDKQTRRRLGQSCPKLRRRNGTWSTDHGMWGYQYELPASGGTRRTARRATYDSSTAAQEALDQVRVLVGLADPTEPTQTRAVGDLIMAANRAGHPLPTTKEVEQRLRSGRPDAAPPTMAEYLPGWLEGRRRLADGTRRSYEGHIRLHLIPNLGTIRIDRLLIEHLDDMIAAIEDRNTMIRDARASGDKARIRAVKGMRIVNPATQQRIRATLRKALNDAIRKRLRADNPAAYLEIESGRPPVPMLWTPERVARWRAIGEVPGPVMVWTPQQTGHFLDTAYDHRLYALYHVYALRGLRRGEGCGLHWTELDIDTGNAAITVMWQIVQHGWATATTRPKTRNSERVVAADADTVAVLGEHRTRQKAERLAAGPGWVDTGLVFTNPDGTALHPAFVTAEFHRLVDLAGLPPIRLHDLRHGAATIALAAGVDMKIVQDMLGHSSITLTADIYTSVLPELARLAAEDAAALIPRTRRTRGGRAA
jgi:integrase